MDHKRLTVRVRDHSYDILIGAGVLAGAGAEIAPLLKRPRVAIVTDENVARHQLAALEASLAGSGITSTVHVVAPGEASKCWATLEGVVEWLSGGADRAR